MVFRHTASKTAVLDNVFQIILSLRPTKKVCFDDIIIPMRK